MVRLHDERVKQIAIGVSLIMAITLLVTGTLIGWRLLPGLLGEWIGMMIGILTTPFFMEASFMLLGLAIVILLNHWRQLRDGDEFIDGEPFNDSPQPLDPARTNDDPEIAIPFAKEIPESKGHSI
jgi:hypothetical protein